MFDAAKAQIARRSALKQVQRRVVWAWTPDPAARRVLVVLPSGDTAREAWRFVKSLGLPPKQIIPVVLSGAVSVVPAAFVSRVIRLEDDDLNWIGLPKRDFAERVWAMEPDVAFSLMPAFDLAAAYLVGASPAPFRVGLFDEEAEPYYDLMMTPSEDGAPMYSLLRDTLLRIRPPVLDLDSWGY